MRSSRNNFGIYIFLFACVSCNKLVSIPEPVNTITTSETFSSEANATSAIVSIYNDMITSGSGYANGGITLFTGLSSDELKYFDQTIDIYRQFQTNSVLVANYQTNPSFWTPMYHDIYLSNAVIEGVAESKDLTARVKSELTGEAKFLRAFCHFYLVNLFGDIPLVTTSAWAHTDTARRTPKAIVYQQIISDLLSAKDMLLSDFSVASGERIRVNKWGAMAFLARVYLYIGDWKNAQILSDSLIKNTALFSLEPNLNNVFLKNSNEAIFQLAINSNNYPYATSEGNTIIPSDPTHPPSYYITDQLLGSFETNDSRRANWLDSISYSGTTYYYPYKYKVFSGSQGNVSEYYMVLRLAEQYLIHAEAIIQQNGDLTIAISDLNALRERAGLSDLSLTLTHDQVLAAVAQERRIELFAEWGHRWFDLKRTNAAHSILSTIDYKQPWKGDYQLLYPIPQSELQADPNLTQNQGYN